jgi:hypothetical protein
MPKVIGATPAYLARPSSGSQIFAASEPKPLASPSKGSTSTSTTDASSTPTPYQGPRRLIASRGAEVFTVVENKIRWADLGAVQDEWEENAQSGSSRFGLSRSNTAQDTEDKVYRVSRHRMLSGTSLTTPGAGCARLLPNSSDIHLALWPLPCDLHRTHGPHSCPARLITTEGDRPVTLESQDISVGPNRPCYPRVSTGVSAMAPTSLYNALHRLPCDGDGRSRSSSMGI